VFIRRDIFRDYGGYDEVLWEYCGKAALGVDDGEFGVRLKRTGEPIGYCRESKVVHPVHAERYSLGSHARIAYYYGWRDPLVFFDSSRPVVEFFRLRQIARLGCRAAVNVVRRDVAAAVCDLADVAVHVGGIVSRLSPVYRQWAALQRTGHRVPAV
jgi:hypothetical protein